MNKKQSNKIKSKFLRKVFKDLPDPKAIKHKIKNKKRGK